MRQTYKHLFCLGLLITILIVNACHKENSTIAKNTTNNTDLIRRIDSIQQADSLLHISLMTDSAIGQYWCAHHYLASSPYRNSDTILGYDTVSVVKTSFNTLVVNGRSYTYYYISDFPTPYYGFLNGSFEAYSSVAFSNHYDSVIYIDQSLIYASGGDQSYHKGIRIR